MAKSWVLTKPSPWGRAFSSALIDKVCPAMPRRGWGGVGAVVKNDWMIM